MNNKEKKEINLEIGTNIRHFREHLCKYSREELAAKTGISPRFLADIETGVVGISLSTLKRICEVLGVSSDRILWSNTTEVGLDERLQHLDSKSIDFIHKQILVQIEMIEYFKNEVNE